MSNESPQEQQLNGARPDQLAGVWKLVSSEFRTPSGTVLRPLGNDVDGVLFYDPDGKLSVQLMKVGRPPFGSNDQTQGTPEEIATAFNGYVSYFGHYEVDYERGVITHRIEGSLFPNWIGTSQDRFFELADDRLTLQTPPIPFEDETIVGILVWERAHDTLQRS